MTSSFEYQTINNIKYISRITYTHHSSSTLTIRGDNQIEFVYVQNQPAFTKYFYGEGRKSDVLLSEIKSMAEGNIVRRYKMNYSSSNNISYLDSITEHNGNGESLNNTVFDWCSGAPIPSYTGIQTFQRNYLQYPQSLSLADVNGDGTDDLITIKNGIVSVSRFPLSMYPEESNLNVIPSVLKYADVNGDGKIDIIEPREGEIYVSLADKDHPYKFLSKKKWATVQPAVHLFADINGDGRADLITPNASNTVKIYLSNESNTFVYSQISFQHFQSSQIPYPAANSTLIGDINGDGLNDIFYILTMNLFINGGSTFTKKQMSLIQTQNQYKIVYFLDDMNSDGLADLVAINTEFNASNRGIWISLSKGDGSFEDFIKWDNPNVENIYEDTQGPFNIPILYLKDINGDGLPDVLRVKNDAIYFAQNTGNGFMYKGSISFPYDRSKESLLIGDANGDGLIDVVKVNAVTGNIGYLFSTGASIDNGNRKIYSITNGFRNNTYVEYEIQRDQHFHTPDPMYSFPLYPYAFFNTRLTVVSRVEQRAKSGGEIINRSQYYFDKPLVHLHGKGFLGFKEMEIVNSRDNIESLSTKISNELYSGFLLPRSKKNYNGSVLLGEEWYEYNIQALANKRYWIKKVSERAYNYLDMKHATTNYTYDAMGNITEKYTAYSSCRPSGEYYYCGETLASERINTTYTQTGEMVYKPDMITVTKRNDISNITNWTAYEYHPKGKLAKEIVYWKCPTCTPSQSATTHYPNYNVFGLPVQKNIFYTGNSDTVKTMYTYDAKGRFVLQTTNALGHIVKYEYESKYGNVTKVTDENGLVTTSQYNGWGNLIKTIYPDNTVSEQSVVWAKNTKVPNAVYYSTSSGTAKAPVYVFYDALGRDVCTYTYSGFLGGKNSYVDTRYNRKGLVEKKSLPYKSINTSDAGKQWISFTYDEYDRLKTETGPKLNKSYTYTVRKQTVTDLLNGDAQYISEYNILGQLIVASDPGGSISYTYNAQGLPTRIKSGNTTTTMNYDIAGNRTSIKEPNAGTITSEYNLLGQLTKQTDARRNFTTFAYDKLGRVKQKFINGNANAEGSATYTYDAGNKAIGKTTTVSAPNHSTSFVYDNLGRISTQMEIISGLVYGLSFVYNSQGRVEKVTYPDNYYVTYGYNALGELSTITNPSGNVIWSVWQKNTRGQLKSYSWGNNRFTELDYDDLGNLTGIRAGNKTRKPLFGTSSLGGEPFLTGPGITDRLDMSKINYICYGEIQNRSYTYDNRGLLSQSRCNKTNQYENYTYDNLNRLTNVTGTNGINFSRHYESGGNISIKDLSLNYLYLNHRPHAVSDIVPNGGNVGGGGSTASQCQTSYTPFNKIQQIIEKENGLDFAYGNDQQRIYTIKKQNGVTRTTRTFVNKYYECETDVYEPRQYNYIYAGNRLVGILRKSGYSQTETMYYVHTDRLGSYEVVTDADGNIVDRLSFDPWGNRRNPDNWAQAESGGTYHIFNRGFTGHEHLDAFKIINMNGRLYDPVTGTFFSPDPFVADATNTQDFNRYAYVRNNPLMYTDPNGEHPFLIALAVFIGRGAIDMLTNNWKGWEGSGKQALTLAVTFGVGSAVSMVAAKIAPEFLVSSTNFMTNLPVYIAKATYAANSAMLATGSVMFANDVIDGGKLDADYLQGAGIAGLSAGLSSFGLSMYDYLSWDRFTYEQRAEMLSKELGHGVEYNPEPKAERGGWYGNEKSGYGARLNKEALKSRNYAKYVIAHEMNHVQQLTDPFFLMLRDKAYSDAKYDPLAMTKYLNNKEILTHLNGLRNASDFFISARDWFDGVSIIRDGYRYTGPQPRGFKWYMYLLNLR